MSLKKSYVKSKKAYKVTFEIPAENNPENKEVRLLGSFNNWSWEDAPTLKKEGGKYTVQHVLPEGKQYEYRYFVDHDYWLNDGKADAYCDSGYGDVENCILDLEVKEVKFTIKQSTDKKKSTNKKKPSAALKTKVADPKSAKKSTAKKSTAKKSTAKKASVKKTASKQTASKKTASKKPTVKKASNDKVDFTKIEGVGPKIAQILQKSGYKTYADLGRAKKKDLLAILEKAGNRYKMHDPSNWAKQSKSLGK